MALPAAALQIVRSQGKKKGSIQSSPRVQKEIAQAKWRHVQYVREGALFTRRRFKKLIQVKKSPAHKPGDRGFA